MVGDLTRYLYGKGMVRYIEGYAQKVNPQKTPQVRAESPVPRCRVFSLPA